MGLFGPQREDVWREFASELGAEYLEAEWLGSDAVVWRPNGAMVVMDYHMTVGTTFVEGRSCDRVTYSARVRAPFPNPAGLQFTIGRTGLFSGIGKLFGMQDIEVGDPEFDRAFVVRGNDDLRLRMLLDDAAYRRQLMACEDAHLTVKEHKPWSSHEGKTGCSDLCCEGAAGTWDKGRLRSLFGLFEATLARLADLDAHAPAQTPRG